MSIKDLNSWFRNLSSNDLANLFPSLYEHAMASADPGVNVNSFYKEVRAEWRSLDKTEKMRLYEELNPQSASRKDAFLNAIDGKEIYYFDDGKLKLNGYFYNADGPVTKNRKKTWRHVELCWCYPDVENIKKDKFAEIDAAETECKQYIGDLTPEEVLQMFACYYKGRKPVPAPLNSDTLDILAAKGEDSAYIDVNALPEFPYEDCAHNPKIRVEIF